MIELHKYVVASDADDALTFISVWQTHSAFRSASGNKIFDDADAAQADADGMIQRAEEESPFGCKVPCDEHSRCVGFHPQVWEVRLTITKGF